LLDERRVAGFTADDAYVAGSMAAESDGVVAKAQRDFAAELLSHDARGVVYGLADGIHRLFGVLRLKAAAQGAGFVAGDAELGADGLMQVPAADVDRLDQVDLPAAADDDLAPAVTDVDQHADGLLVFAAAHKAIDR